MITRRQRPALEWLAGFAPARPGWRPGLLLLHQSHGGAPGGGTVGTWPDGGGALRKPLPEGERSRRAPIPLAFRVGTPSGPGPTGEGLCESPSKEQEAGIEPATPVRRTGVSPQHFTCGGVLDDAEVDEPPDEHRRDRTRSSRTVARIVGRVGIEPTSGRIKNPLQGQHLLPTQAADVRTHADGEHGPTPWNRTRTSRASARRADQLRKSGMCPRSGPDAARGHARSGGAAAVAPRGRAWRGDVGGRLARRPRRSSLQLS